MNCFKKLYLLVSNKQIRDTNKLYCISKCNAEVISTSEGKSSVRELMIIEFYEYIKTIQNYLIYDNHLVRYHHQRRSIVSCLYFSTTTIITLWNCCSMQNRFGTRVQQATVSARDSKLHLIYALSEDFVRICTKMSPHAHHHKSLSMKHIRKVSFTSFLLE